MRTSISPGGRSASVNERTPRSTRSSTFSATYARNAGGIAVIGTSVVDGPSLAVRPRAVAQGGQAGGRGRRGRRRGGRRAAVGSHSGAGDRTVVIGPTVIGRRWSPAGSISGGPLGGLGYHPA